MDVLREREVKDSLERQLTEEQKLRSEFQMKFTFCHVFRAHASNQYFNEL